MADFNVRVYGLLPDNHGNILLSHELHGGMAIVKLPGGAVESGEGLKDALQREYWEECGMKVEVRELVYATDFNILSAITGKEVICIYYAVRAKDPDAILNMETEHKLVWTPVNAIRAEHFTFKSEQQLWRTITTGKLL